MLYYALVALVIAIIAGILGFGGIAFAAAGIAKILFFIFLVVFLISLIGHGHIHLITQTLDEASSRVRLQAMLPPPAIREADAQLRKLIAEKEAVVKNQEFDRAASIRDREEKLRLEKASLEQEWRDRRLMALLAHKAGQPD